MCCHGRWWVSSVLSWSSVPGHACIGPLNRESIAQHVCSQAYCMNAELGFGIIRGFEGPELAGTPAQQTCSRCERAHGLCRRSSKLGFRLVASRLRRTSVGRKLETKLSGNAELGFVDGVWSWTGLRAFGRRQAKKNATATRPWRRADC